MLLKNYNKRQLFIRKPLYLVLDNLEINILNKCLEENHMKNFTNAIGWLKVSGLILLNLFLFLSTGNYFENYNYALIYISICLFWSGTICLIIGLVNVIIEFCKLIFNWFKNISESTKKS